MKFLQFLLIAFVSATLARPQTPQSTDENLMVRASAQLERLAPYRKLNQPSDREEPPEPPKTEDETNVSNSEQLALEVYQILPQDLQRDIVRRVGGNEAMFKLLADPNYMALLRERIKRSETGYSYGHGGHDGGYGGDSYGGEGYGHTDSGSGGIISGSGSIIKGIAGGIIGSIVSASSGASKGSSGSSSSEHAKPEYGHGYSYEENHFDVWDFKKAIFNTLVQAVKAISGGVIALKGQLIKGGGYLISTKGKIISTTGDAISSLGRQIASSAIVSPPHHSHQGYSYEAPHSGDDHSYSGPPPSAEYSGAGHDYSHHSGYSAPADDEDHAGLLIAKPTNPDVHPREPQHTPDVPPEAPHVENTVQDLESYHDPGSVSQHLDHLDHGDKGVHTYHALLHSVPQLPDHGSPISIQQSVEYPPIHVQYHDTKGRPDPPKGDSFGNDLAVYSSVSIDVDPQIQAIKFSALKPSGGYELPKSQINFHGFPAFGAMPEPLKIPIINPMPHYWPGQGLPHPMDGFGLPGLHRRRSALRRKGANDVARSPFLTRNTKLQRV